MAGYETIVGVQICEADEPAAAEEPWDVQVEAD